MAWLGVLVQLHSYDRPLVPLKSYCGLSSDQLGLAQSRSFAICVPICPGASLSHAMTPVPRRCWWVLIEMRCVFATPAWNWTPVDAEAFGGMSMFMVPQKEKPAGL